MTSAGGFGPGKLWSLWDMLKYNAASFYMATDVLYKMRAASNDKSEKKEPLAETIAEITLRTAKDLQSSLLILGTKVTCNAVDRLLRALAERPLKITYSRLYRSLDQIDTCLKDELPLVTTFVIESEKTKYYEPAEPLFGNDFESKYAISGVYEIDEAAKCMALSRDTAAVFHLMRCMEIGIRTVAKCLGIPDPIGSDRNWWKILEKIKDAMDVKTRSRTWHLKDRELFESTYGSLDAVRIAWRNTTMHVENKYSAEEAEHIFIAVRGFMKQLASRMDDQGQPRA
jgi:hypothetical protein